MKQKFLPLVLIAGPCQMESRDHAFMMAENIKKITDKLGIQFIYKSSFDKANRTSVEGKRGMGLEKTLPIFTELKKTFGCPILTDIHNEQNCRDVANYVDIIQSLDMHYFDEEFTVKALLILQFHEKYKRAKGHEANQILLMFSPIHITIPGGEIHCSSAISSSFMLNNPKKYFIDASSGQKFIRKDIWWLHFKISI